MARSRVQKDLTDQRVRSLAVLQIDHLHVVLKEIVIFLRARLDGRIRQQDEDRILPLLARADLTPQRRRLVEIGADAQAFDGLQDAMIEASHRLGAASAIFLAPWSYLLFWGSEKGLDLPIPLTAVALGLAAACAGFGLSQGWQERTAQRALRKFAACLRGWSLMRLTKFSLQPMREILERLRAYLPPFSPRTAATHIPIDMRPPVAQERVGVPRPGTEQEMVNHILRHIVDLEPGVGSIKRVAREIRTHGRSRGDVLLLADDLVAIEAKLSDWKRALGQAALNLTVVDRSYVAMWSGHVPPSLLVSAEEHGIGVVEVSSDGLQIVVRSIAGTPDPTARCIVLQRLEDDVRLREGASD